MRRCALLMLLLQFNLQIFRFFFICKLHFRWHGCFSLFHLDRIAVINHQRRALFIKYTEKKIINIKAKVVIKKIVIKKLDPYSNV